MHRKPNERTILAGIGILCLVWGSTWLVIREGLRELPPFTSVAARLVLACLVFASIAPRLARLEGGGRPSLAASAAHGVLTLAVPYAIIYWTETRLSSGLTCVLWSVYPLLVGLCAHAFLPAERLSGGRWLAVLLAVGGVVTMFVTDIRAAGPESVRAGLVLLLSPAASALGTTFLKRRGGGTSSVLLNRNGMALAALLVALVALLAERGAPLTFGPRAIASIVYLALVGTVFAFGLYFWLLRHAPAIQLSLIAVATPVVAVTLGAVFAGERIGPATGIGMGCVLAGIVLFMKMKPRPASQAPLHGAHSAASVETSKD
jgi:drug/metabolite transporter (DMT)-like permease